MKPLKLTMQAFGPYARTETIDFRQLESRTMFVISGKTGSGKTTIFDGISYAIYGKASGEDRNGPDLRSQFAQDDLLTEVSLEFSLRQKTYLITRSPQQEKKKKNSDGTTMLGAKAELYLIDENGELQLLASNVREVDEKIKEIMIIDSNQFRQILMIPQGEFRKLLTSDSKDKELILQRLFHTEVYKKVEEKLKEEATVLKKSVEDQVEKRNTALRSIKASENPELKEYIEAGSVNDMLIMPLLKLEIEAMAAKLEQLNLVRIERQKERDSQQERLFEAQTTLKQLETLEALRLKKENLAGQQENFKRKEAEADLAKKAALLATQEQLCHRLKAECDSLTDQAEEISKKIMFFTEKLAKAELEHQQQLDREPERKAASEHKNKLENMRDDVMAFASIAKSVDELSQNLHTSKQEREKAEQTIKAAEERLKSLQAEKEAAEKAQLSLLENDRRLEKLQFELDKLQKKQAHSQKVGIANQTYNQKKEAYNNVKARFEDSKATVIALEQNWLYSQAAVLAASLHEGVSCPVCGSEHHPKPAQASDEFIPTEEDLKAAREQAAKLDKEKSITEKAFIEAEANLNSLTAAAEELTSEIKSFRPDFKTDDLTDVIMQIQSDQRNVQEEQKKIAIKVNSQEKIILEMKRFEDGIEKQQKQQKTMEENYHQMVIQYTEKRTTLERITQKIPEDMRSIEMFEKKLSDAIRLQEQLDFLLEQARKTYHEAKEHLGTVKARGEDAEKRLKKKNDELNAERDLFKNNMIAQGFENFQLYHQGKKPERDIQLLDTEIRNYREELRSVSDRYDEMAKMLQDVKKPDIESLQKEFSNLNEKIKQADEAYQDLNLKKRDNQAVFEIVESLNEQMKVLEERYKLVGHLYEISKGQNTYRITFERFVLAAFLDDILSEANVRLNKMTSGRYRLLRKTDRSKGNVQSGLELLVLDAYTGQERHVKTLSGGESFKAALSLALGLADVVQNYAGGVSLETMFIDEGFGTLDPESLDQAIEALIDIQSSGRLVGIISHVPELKERIDARLEVISTQTGSKTEFHLMN
jgi:DNA repair protein SbcC/Rad50